VTDSVLVRLFTDGDDADERLVRDYDAARGVIDDLRVALDDLERTVDAVEERGGIDYYDGPFPEGEAPDDEA
jgi:hypothetical protein